MTTRDDNPRWLAAALTALPVLLAAAWAIPARPPAPRPDPPAAAAPTDSAPDLHARSR